MVHNYLFICTDADSVIGKSSAHDVAMGRLKKKMWPLYAGTRNRIAIKTGDQCLFYLAGKMQHSQHFIAHAEIEKKSDWKKSDGLVDGDNILSSIPQQVLLLAKIRFVEPVSIRSFLKDLSFIPITNGNWGAAMQGGCKRMTREDYDIILSSVRTHR